MAGSRRAIGHSGLKGYQGASEWAAALANGACSLTDGSKPGDWRLPTDVEWEEVIADAKRYSCDMPPYVLDTDGKGCWVEG